MRDNILFLYQNIYTLTPLLFAGLLGLMMITKKWKMDLILTLFLVIDGLCSSLMLYGYWEEALIVVDVSSVIVVFWAVFRERKICIKGKK